MRTVISDLMLSCLGARGVHRQLFSLRIRRQVMALLRLSPAVLIAAPQPEPPPAPSSPSRVSTGGKDSTKSLSRTGVKD
jgi:hypothetical protein